MLLLESFIAIVVQVENLVLPVALLLGFVDTQPNLQAQLVPLIVCQEIH